MIRSMTGFASGTGTYAPYTWGWDLRSVNGKGQDLRLRVPDWVDGLEAALRTMLAKSAARGNVTLSLRIARDETLGGRAGQCGAACLCAERLGRDRGARHGRGRLACAVEARQTLWPCAAFWNNRRQRRTRRTLTQALTAAFPELLDAFNAMRTSEGAALEKVLQAQLAESRCTDTDRCAAG